jgi:hypothetical protein
VAECDGWSGRAKEDKGRPCGGLTTPLAACHRLPRGPRLTEDFTGIFQPRTALILTPWPAAFKHRFDNLRARLDVHSGVNPKRP